MFENASTKLIRFAVLREHRMRKNIVGYAVLFCMVIVSVASASSRSGIVTLDVDLSSRDPGKKAKLWIPYPLTDRNQKVSDIKVSGDYVSSAVYTDAVYGTPILYAEWPVDAKSRKLNFSFAVDRKEIRQTALPGIEPEWNRADYAEYLKPTTLAPIDGDVKKLADSITKGKRSVLEKARAIYDWCCSSMYRDPNAVGCGKGDVCALLQKPGGKCTDISSVFVALCRAAGVPARELFSIRLGKS
jgi:transglutaminase-like putative cysteine protease